MTEANSSDALMSAVVVSMHQDQFDRLFNCCNWSLIQPLPFATRAAVSMKRLLEDRKLTAGRDFNVIRTTSLFDMLLPLANYGVLVCFRSGI